jgi:hypothetical protein
VATGSILGVAALAPFAQAHSGHVHGSGGRQPHLANWWSTCLYSVAAASRGQDRSVSSGSWSVEPSDRPPMAGHIRSWRGTAQGMARVRSGQAPAWPLSSGRSVRRDLPLGSSVKRDFACTFTGHLPSVLVVLRAQSCLMLEGRARTLSGPSRTRAQPGPLHLPPSAKTFWSVARSRLSGGVCARRFDLLGVPVDGASFQPHPRSSASVVSIRVSWIGCGRCYSFSYSSPSGRSGVA